MLADVIKACLAANRVSGLKLGLFHDLGIVSSVEFRKGDEGGP
jgi:hypothetical protein